MGVSFFEGYRGGFLKWRNAAVADTRVGGGDVFDQFRGSDEPADTPAGAVEVLAAATDGKGQGGDFGGEGRHACEFGVVEAVVDFVAEDEDVVFYAEVADSLEFVAGEDFADGVVGRVEHDHAGAWRDGCFELGEV